MRAFLAAAVLLVAAAACGGDGPGTPSSAQDWLARAQEAVDGADGYRLVMTGHNFTIPQWGGNDGGELVIGRDGTTASGTLVRTGDGEYAVVYAANQTYFKRTTCDHYARIPGGGPDVLRPFLFARTGALSDVESALISSGPTAIGDSTTSIVAIVASISDIGPVQIAIDASTFLPVHLYLADDGNGTTQQWTFSDWGAGPEIATPVQFSGDQGPGGNPC